MAIFTLIQLWVDLEKARQVEVERASLMDATVREEHLRQDLSMLREELGRLRRVGESTTSSESEVMYVVTELKEDLAEAEVNLNALREALDPTTEEVLTIARLKDRVIALEEDRREFEERLLEQFGRFERSVQLQLEASSDSVRWLFVILIPLVLNFVYTVWRDQRDNRRSEAKKG